MPLLMIIALLAAASLAEAKDQPVQEARPINLAIVVVEDLERDFGAVADFDRIDMAFQQVAKARNWPVTIRTERLTARTKDHPIELRIYQLPFLNEMPGELTYRGWMTLKIHGKKHDFGIITFRYRPRSLERGDDIVMKLFCGAADAVVPRLEPLLFPQPDPAATGR